MSVSNFQLDLHTHSIISYDGGITPEQYRRYLAEPNRIVAVTDHNEISLALKLHVEFPNQIIVGEEIKTLDGEIIGLYLKELIQPHLSVEETIRQIRSQGGLVYVPHPMEKRRSGLTKLVWQRIANQIDVLEVYNARTIEIWLRNKVKFFLEEFKIVGTASSDAHCIKGLGSSFAVLATMPSKENLVELLRGAKLSMHTAPFASWFCPLKNKIAKRLKV